MLVVDVEEVAHEAPAVAKHLRVLGGGLDPHPHPVEVEAAVVAARSTGRPHHPPVGTGPEEQMLTVVGHGDCGRLLDEVLGLPVLHGVLEQLPPPKPPPSITNTVPSGPGARPA